MGVLGRAALVFALSSLAMIWPAIENGYPLAMVDTARHLGMIYVHPIFPYGYNVWLFPLQVPNLPWVVVAAQGALMVGLIWAAMDRVGDVRSSAKRGAVTAVLALATSASFVASMLLPDYFTSIGLLAVAVAPWVEEKRLEIALGAVIGCAAVTHYSHAPLFAATLATCAALLWRLHKESLRRLIIPVAATVMAGLVLATANWICFDRWTYSISGPTFLLGRLEEDGPALAYLREQCPSRDWRLCGHLDRLPLPHLQFLFNEDSPVEQSGGFIAVRDESAQIVRGIVLSRPGAVFPSLFRNALGQLQSFVLFPDASDLGSPWFWERAALHPAFERSVRSSKQFQHGLDKPWLRNLQVGAVIVSAFLLLPLCWMAARRNAVAAVVFALTLAAGVVFNAVITGGLSAVDARYGTRVIWLLPFVAAVLVLARAPQTRARG